jgi:F420-dependent oxidoreductase-like protein
MKIGLQVPEFTWAGGPATLGQNFAAVAKAVDDCGFDSLWVMDHFFQIGAASRAPMEMLEGYTALAFAAGVTKRVRLGTMVTGVTYRHPGILAKTVTTLDVLSGGRAWLGIGAAWNDREHRGLGVPFPPIAERFERLEETLQICLQMWSGQVGEYHGKHYDLTETLNSPQALSKPHPPILIGGGGERKTLRLVAQYAQGCNIFNRDAATLKHKLDVLRQHCDKLGRSYDDIEKTSLGLNFSANQRTAGAIVDQLTRLHHMGIQHAIFSIPDVAANLDLIELIGKDVLPQIRTL